MKLTEHEKEAVALLRKLDERQREKLLARMQREVLANSLITRVGKLSKLEITSDRKIERAYGVVPTWRSKRKPP